MEFVVTADDQVFRTRKSGRPCVYGFTPSDQHIVVIFEEADADCIYPITAFEVPERYR